MNTSSTPTPQPAWVDDDEDEEGVTGGNPRKFKTLSPAEAQAIKAKLPMLSPWKVVMAQAVVGAVCVLLGLLLSGGIAAWSALYGALAVVLPNALLARGMSKQAGNAVAMAAGFLVWEMLKIAAAIAVMVIAAKVVPHLSWPVLLVTLVVCMKVSWLALLWRGRKN